MLDNTKLRLKAVACTLRHPSRGVFRTRQGRFEKAWLDFARVNASQKRWRRRSLSSILDTISSGSVESGDELFSELDTVEPAARLDHEYDETAPLAASEPWIVKSIQAVFTNDKPQPTGYNLSTLCRQEWTNNYTFVRNITPGNQGRVDIYNDLTNQNQVIVKKIKVSDAFPKEAQMMKKYLMRTSPASIINVHGVFYDHDLQSCNLILEYCSGGDLFDFTNHWLYDRVEQIPEIFLLHFIASMGEALGWLHLGRIHVPFENGFGMPGYVEDPRHQTILHRDMKLENIFLRWNRNNWCGMPDIVLGDFGGAVLASESTGGFGTSGYFPPEVLQHFFSSSTTTRAQHKGPIMTEASDIYTFGVCLCYMMLWGDFTPGMDMEPTFLKSNLKNWPLLLELLEDCLEEDPRDRVDTGTLFNWAPVLRAHVRGLFEHGVRMPEGSWPVVGVRNGGWGSSDEGSDETSSTAVSRLLAAERANGSDGLLSSIYDGSVTEMIDALPVTDEPEATVQQEVKLPGRSFSTVYEDPITTKANKGQHHAPPRKVEEVHVPQPRTSVLFEIVERMAKNLGRNNTRSSTVFGLGSGKGWNWRLNRSRADSGYERAGGVALPPLHTVSNCPDCNELD